MQERRISVCQVCGVRPAEEAHHCLYGKDKRFKQLNDDENLQLVCIECHKYNGGALGYENKLRFWEWACEFYGHKHMVEWHNRLPMKIKEKGYQ